MKKKIKVLITDDAAFMRKTVRKILESSDVFEIVGVAKNGEEAVKLNLELKPDVITLDIDMPVMDGITATKHLLVQRPVPIVIISSLSYEPLITFGAFRLGVVDFIPKPAGAISKELAKQKKHICHVVEQAASVDVSKIRRALLQEVQSKETGENIPSQKVAILGSSIGGASAIIKIVSGLSKTADFSVVALTKMSSKIMDSFVGGLDSHTKIKVRKGRSNQLLNQGEVYLYPIDSPPLLVDKLKDGVYALKGAGETISENPIDGIMSSAVQASGLEVLGVLLNGTGKDGVVGIQQIQSQFGKTIGQKVESALFPEKVQFALDESACAHVLEVQEIAEKIAILM